MPVHRSSAFIVIRELAELLAGYREPYFVFDAVIGVYHSIQRAEEVAGSSAQALKDAGVSDGAYRFTVKATTYYDE